MGFIQLLKMKFLVFLCFFGFCFGSFGWVFAFRLVRKCKEKVPKCPGKGPPEAQICGSSGNPRKRKKGCVKPTWTIPMEYRHRNEHGKTHSDEFRIQVAGLVMVMIAAILL